MILEESLRGFLLQDHTQANTNNPRWVHSLLETVQKQTKGWCCMILYRKLPPWLQYILDSIQTVQPPPNRGFYSWSEIKIAIKNTKYKINFEASDCALDDQPKLIAFPSIHVQLNQKNSPKPVCTFLSDFADNQTDSNRDKILLSFFFNIIQKDTWNFTAAVSN